ncbi:hypothetical protein C8J56DRAFT_824267 [Mycena floridula]|nr:hypothetical protein C8J56DRAFT_824267 [Mycena floridula]
MKNWDEYGRSTVDLASATASMAFSAAKITTRMGFAVTRNLAGGLAATGATIADYTLFGGLTVARPIVGGTVSTVIAIAEQLTLAPIFISEYITSTSILAAHSSINVLSVIFPGSSEASFSLASFINLVKKEWNDPAEGASMPKDQYGITQIARAIIAWVALQGVTQEWQEKNWLKYLKEINVKDPPRNFDSIRSRRGSRVRVTSEITFPGNIGHLLAADIGVAPPRAQTIFSPSNPKARAKPTTSRPKAPRITMPKAAPSRSPPKPTNTELKSTLRRLSKLVLAGYGGASLLFFGVPLTSASPPLTSSSSSSTTSPEEATQLANAINASEAEAAGDGNAPPAPAAESYSWWDVLLGKHDHEIVQNYATGAQTIGKSTNKGKAPANGKVDVMIGHEHLMPRFWVLTDHGRRQVVLVLRGTMSLNEIAVDLTCDSEEFFPGAESPTKVDDDDEEYPESEHSPLPGRFQFPTSSTPRRSKIPSFEVQPPTPDNPEPGPSRPKQDSEPSFPKYHAHSGMYRMAKAMGDIGRPVHTAVREALFHNLEYDLVLCGHSLGAGVAALLGLMWADPETCRTVRSSGLPVGRRVSVYCFAPPTVTSGPLSKLASPLIVSFVYSHDVVSRISLGSIRDLRNAALWLCEEESKKGHNQHGAGYATVTQRAKKWKNGQGRIEDEEWFIAVRKTLEANMQSASMFPPGRVLWAMRDSDLHPSHRSKHASDSTDPSSSDKLRLFEVLDVEKVFGQIVFARDMLGAHMPNKYDSVLHDLL